MLYEQKFLFSLLFTLIVEVPIVCLLIKYFYKKAEIKIFEIIFVGLMANALTLPYFWFILPVFVSNRGGYIIIGELLVVLIETIIYNQLLKLKLSESFIISLITNCSSMLLGLLLRYIDTGA